MYIKVYGKTFDYLLNDAEPFPARFAAYGKYILNTVKEKVSKQFPDSNNIIITGIWFGKQYNNGEYEQLIRNKHVDNIFYISAIDPVSLTDNEINEMLVETNSPALYKIGNFDNSNYSFSTHANTYIDLLYKSNIQQLTSIKHKFINYNNKPTEHRVRLVELIKNYKCGLITLGKTDDDIVTQAGLVSASFGDLDTWNTHFLNVVSETTYEWHENIFVSEKTYKPLIGLRPFIINGNTRIYKYLRNNGFKTFNNYFPFAELENIMNKNLHENIIKVLTFICATDNKELLNMYTDMLPDLLYNRERFKEFKIQEMNKIKNLTFKE